jgi:hypothetical protein
MDLIERSLWRATDDLEVDPMHPFSSDDTSGRSFDVVHPAAIRAAGAQGDRTVRKGGSR